VNPGTDLPILIEETFDFCCAKLFSFKTTGSEVFNSGMELSALSEEAGISCA
jgi:hypothetical protein